MSIKQLPPDVIAQVKSSSVITSLNGVIIGLVRNSLDARATNVVVSVDYRLGNCSVEDNGVGIPPAEFREDGGLGRPHFTSKHPPGIAVYGRYGVFLSSVAALSLLTVTSHHRFHNSHNSLTIHHSEVVSRSTPAPPEHRILTFPHGTRATVRNLFGTMPVRVKQRALDAGRSTPGRDWDQLVRMVVSLLLSFSKDVSLSVRDSGSARSLTLRSDDSELVARMPRLLSRASLWDNVDADWWVPIGASSTGISIDGCISLVPVATKRLQFISFGIEPLLDELGTNVLSAEINRVFANSRFGTVEDRHGLDCASADKAGRYTGRDLKLRKGIDRWPVFYLRVALDTPGPVDPEDVLQERHVSLALIVDLLKAMSYTFLKKYHFSPHQVKVAMRGGPRSPRSPPRPWSAPEDRDSEACPDYNLLELELRHEREAGPGPRQEISGARDISSALAQTPMRRSNEISQDHPFEGWTRVKVGGLVRGHSALSDGRSYSEQNDLLDGSNRESSPRTGEKTNRLFDSSGKLLHKPFPEVDVNKPTLPTSDASNIKKKGGMERPNPTEDVASECFYWEDPVTKIVSLIDSRTGFIIGPKPDSPAAPGDRPTQLDPIPGLKNLVSGWKNPVFEAAEPSIPRLAGMDGSLTRLQGGQNFCSRSLNIGTWGDRTSLTLDSRISKDSLRVVEVIAQVDRKFIFVKVPISNSEPQRESNRQGGSTSCILVLIDQHAADERCRVETLMREYFEPLEGEKAVWRARTEALGIPMRFDLSSQDCVLLKRLQDYFEQWGILYEVPTAASVSGVVSEPREKIEHRIEVRSLPPAIIERCRSEPNTLIELLRKEAWDVEGVRLQARRAIQNVVADGHTEFGWVSRFHGCPAGILDLINSRACRSAIMFNDPLSVEECQSLVGRLSRCAFPFQCAHGRPSMVPLLDIGSPMMGIDAISGESDLGKGFLSQFDEQGLGERRG